MDPRGCVQLFSCLLLQAVLVALLGLRAAAASGCPFRPALTPRSLETRSALAPTVTGSCDQNNRYRTLNGTCNNLAHPDWGSAGTELTRLLPPDYDDGAEVPRFKTASGEPLPSAREVSNACHPSASDCDEHPDVSLLVMAWGQFMDHDITLTSAPEPMGCCQGMQKENGTHSDMFSGGSCFPIQVPTNDPYFRQPCLEFARSSPARETLGPNATREQINGITSFLDASMVYGSSDAHGHSLRTHTGGLLKAGGHTCEALPTMANHVCPLQPPNDPCFEAGDERVNEVPSLMSLHLVFLRNHNRLARALHDLSPAWGDERLYQEARRLNIAILQHIAFSEWLPLVLGQKGMALAGLDKPYRYDPNLNPSILNEFSTAAFRFGHSMVPRRLQISSGKSQPLSSTFFRPNLLGTCTPGESGLIKGLLENKIDQVNEVVTAEIKNKLFLDVFEKGASQDLVSRNIQRGRDHGLPAYGTFLQRFRHLYDLHGAKTASFFPKCLRAYRLAVEEIDLFTAFLTEPVYDGILPFALNYVVGLQMFRLRDGDRFWFESSDPRLGFTAAQLREIRQVTIASVLCDNSSVGSSQRQAFRASSKSNPVVSCASLPRMNIDVFKAS